MGVTCTDLPRALGNRIVIDAGSDCWLWQGAVNRGYGRVYVAGELRYAHREVYVALIGSIPEGMELDHLCRTKLCVNPAHVEPVTTRENGRRGIKGVLTTHCPSGHRYDEHNTRIRPNGHRVCRSCHREREAARRAAA